MSDYWKGLMDWNCEGYQASKKVTGKTDSTLEINVLDVREQIQEDIITYLDNVNLPNHKHVDDLCQIVIDNFKKLEK
jgi:hypothetical protein